MQQSRYSVHNSYTNDFDSILLCLSIHAFVRFSAVGTLSVAKIKNNQRFRFWGSVYKSRLKQAM